MRSELNEVYQIDQYLLGRLSKEEERAFEASLLLDEAIAEQVEVQRTAHRLIRRYARREERRRLEAIYRLLLQEPDFAHKIKTI
jgi:anti-sigma factor RsiW